MRDIYLIPDMENIEASIALAEKYHARFEYNDFYKPSVLDDEQQMNKIIAFYQALSRDRSEDTLHGAFLDIAVHSEDSLIREASERRVRQCMDIADKLGIRGVIFHTNIISNFCAGEYRRNWIESNERFWRTILSEYPRLSIFIENMFDEEPETLATLAEQMKNEERFGVCLDYAHAQVFGHESEEWVKTLGAYVKHMHINDNDLKSDLHKSVGSGSIDWTHFTDSLEVAKVDSTVLIETKSIEKQRESLEYMEVNKIYPFK